MTIKSLVGVSVEDILEVFNTSFSDYFVPFHISLEQLHSKIKSEKINLEFSVGAFNNAKLVGFILHGFDIIDNQRIIYNAGTGVIPSERGQGLTKKMYSFMLPILKKQKVNHVVLEVISNNIQAIRSYEAAGFKIVRKLGCYKGEVKSARINTDVEIKALENYDWKFMQSFWDIAPTWQNSSNVIDELKGSNKSIGAYINNQLVGYLVFNPSSKRIQQIAVHKNNRRKKIALSLINIIIKEFGNELGIINVEKNSKSINNFFLNIGLVNYIDQMEMRLKLGSW